MNLVTYCGKKFYFRYFGSEINEIAPVVFLSGAFQNMESWARYYRRFEKYTKILLIDLPGTGHSDPISSDVSVDFLANCVKIVVDQLNIPKFNIISTSYGTPIAHRFCQLNQGRVNKVALGGTMKKIPEYRRKIILDSIQAIKSDDLNMFSEIACKVLLNTTRSDSIKKYKFAFKYMKKMTQNISGYARNHYIQNTLRLLNHPELDLSISSDASCLIVTGEYDHFTKPSYCREIAKSFERCYFTTIKGCDHLFTLEDIQTTLDMLYNFFFDLPLEDIQGLNKVEHIQNPIMVKKQSIDIK